MFPRSSTSLTALFHGCGSHLKLLECVVDGTGEVVLEVRRPAEDRYIVLSAKRNRRTTAQQVANQFLAASGKQISRKTVTRLLRGGELYARRPVVCVPLTIQHRTARLQWCREHHNWTEQDWACVLFSDESRFSLSSDCRRQLIWHESGTAYRPKIIQEKDRYPTCSIMILNPIENVWDALGRQGAHPHTLNEVNTLIRALTEEWDKLPQQLLDNVVQIYSVNFTDYTFFIPYKREFNGCAKIKDEVEKLAIQLNEEAERTERPIRRLRTAIRVLSSGRPRGTTPADDRYVFLQAKRNRRQTAGEIARHTTQATGRPISRFTVARRLHGGGLFARRPVWCVPLTPVHRRRRSVWCREHRNWRDNEWERVLFIDESRFSFSSDSHRILIWRERGSRNHPSNIIERDRYGGRGVLVWGGIMLGSHTDLHIFDAGSVNGTRYCNDNAPCHRTVAAEQLLESEDTERMDWLARSPDLNPIEHVWDFLGRRLAARTLPPVTIRELRLALQDEWAAMPQQLIDTLILSMGRRCETCLAVRGDHIPY
ncbi:transposable element Tcb2 transposase [Trichonephila clavipes]|nr:transposable element Tcb2 transposase [Trichonephila clavipes]